MAFVKGFHKLSDVLDTICSYIIVVMLGAMVVITGAQIVCRSPHSPGVRKRPVTF